jgi:pheromone shutdown protein TraB
MLFDYCQFMTSTKDEQIGFHKGALSVLLKEQEAFVQMISVIRQLLQAHASALKELGVDLEAEMKKAQEAAKKQGLDGKVAKP